MYGIIWCLDLPSKLGDLETFILLTSCICHDLDHPGFNNIYQVRSPSDLSRSLFKANFTRPFGNIVSHYSAATNEGR